MRDIQTKQDNVDTLAGPEFNSYMVELENAVLNSGVALDPALGPDTNSEMLSEAITRAAQGASSYQDSGSANNYVLSAIGVFEQPSEYRDGMIVFFRAGASNTGASTINVSSLGVKDLVDASGTALSADDIVINNYYAAQYDLTGDEFRVIISGSSDVAESSETVSGTVEKATQAEAEAETVDKNITADNAKFLPNASKIGFSINGGTSPTITDDHGGTATISRIATGTYQVTLPNAITNMRPLATAAATGGVLVFASLKVEVDSATQFTIDFETSTGAGVDFNASVEVFGEFV